MNSAKSYFNTELPNHSLITYGCEYENHNASCQAYTCISSDSSR